MLTVKAVNFLPEPIDEFISQFGTDGAGVTSYIVDKAVFIMYLVFGFIILLAIYNAILAAIKYIRSQGDQAQIDEAQKAIKAIFMGIGALFVGILGIILVFVFFNVRKPSTPFTQTCFAHSDSIACKTCLKEGSLTQNNFCTLCERQYKEIASNLRESKDLNVVCKTSLGTAENLNNFRTCVANADSDACLSCYDKGPVVGSLCYKCELEQGEVIDSKRPTSALSNECVKVTKSNATSGVKANYRVCEKASDSVGCSVCKQEGVLVRNACDICESYWQSATLGAITENDISYICKSSSTTLPQNAYRVCKSAPNSVACFTCKKKKVLRMVMIALHVKFSL